MNKNKLFFVLLALLIIPFNTVFGQEVKTLEQVSCFEDGLYEFQSVQVSAGPEESSYTPGETINFVGEVINENDYPIFDGNVFVRIKKDNPEYFSEGHHTMYEFIAVSDVAVDGSSSKQIGFTWKVPQDIGGGEYRADYFFSVGKKFNLGGLPFTNEIIIGYSLFEIESNTETPFILDRSKTSVNGENYRHIGEWPRVLAGDKIEITQSLENFSNSTEQYDIEYSLYSWDGLNESDLIDTKNESVTVEANSSLDLNYTIDSVNVPVYYLKIKAKKGDLASVVNIRIVSDINNPRLNFPAINKFPLMEGDSATLFSCFHTISDIEENSRLELNVTDEDGNTVIAGEYKGDIDTFVSAGKADFTANKDYSYLKIDAKLYNGNNELVDSYDTEYSCDNLISDQCSLLMAEEVRDNTILISIIFLLLALLLIFLSHKNKDNKITKNILTVFAILSLVIAGYFTYSSLDKIESLFAEEVSADGKTKSASFGSGNFTAYTRGGRKISTLSANMAHSVKFIGNFQLDVGDTISYTSSGECTYSKSGGAWDTPYCNGTSGSLSDSDGSTDGSYSFTVDSQPSISAMSFDPSILSCSGMTCTAVSPGTVNTGVNIGNVKITGYAETTVDGTHSDSTTWEFGSYKPRWSVTVIDPTPTNGQCNASIDGNYSSSEPTTGTLCSAGSSTTVTDNGDGTYSWICEGVYGTPEEPVTDDSCNTTPPQCSDGIDNDGDGDVDSADTGCGGGGGGVFDNNENDIDGLSCLITSPTEPGPYRTGTAITMGAFISGFNDNANVTYNWSGDMTGSGQTASATFDNPGTFNAAVSATYDGVTRGPVQCSTEISISNVPDITFEIPVIIADDNGMCEANWTVDNGVEANCTIITEFNNITENLGIVTSPSEGNLDLGAGNEYRLKCVTNDIMAEEVISDAYKCIDPSLREI